MMLAVQLVFADINDIKELGKAMDDLSFEKSAVSGSKTAYKVGIAKYTFNRPYKTIRSALFEWKKRRGSEILLSKWKFARKR